MHGRFARSVEISVSLDGGNAILVSIFYAEAEKNICFRSARGQVLNARRMGEAPSHLARLAAQQE